MDVVETARPRARGRVKPVRAGWATLTFAGAAAFWSANLLISVTPSAAAYRSALSIQYVPMLVEAAAGGLAAAGLVALMLTRFPGRIPGADTVRKALFLALCTLVALTVLIEVPAKLTADIDDPERWLFVGAVFNTIRVMALGLAIGLVARAQGAPADHPRLLASKEKT